MNLGQQCSLTAGHSQNHSSEPLEVIEWEKDRKRFARQTSKQAYRAVIEECCHEQKSDVGEWRQTLIDRAIAAAVREALGT